MLRMSTMSEWGTLKDRMTGKWQLPLLVVSLVMLTASFLRLRPAPEALPLDEAIEYLDVLLSGGAYDRAIELGESLLTREELAEADRARIHLYLGRARFGEVARRSDGGGAVASQVVGHYRHATSHGQSLEASDYEIIARAYERQRKFAEALEQYGRAIDSGIDHPFDLRKRMLTLSLDHIDTPLEDQRESLERFVADVPDHRLDLALWAIERELEILKELSKPDEAATLLTRHRDRFRQSDLRDRFAYLEGWLLYETGHYDQAEVHLRTVRNRVEPADEVFAMTGWLLGRVVMHDSGPQRPQEALSFFSSVIQYHAGTPYGVAARVGAAEALMMLERHAEAIDAYRTAVEELAALGEQRVVDRDVLRTSLSVVAEAQRRIGRLSEAVAYARLAAELTDPANVEQATLFLQQLAQLQSQLAAQLEEESLAAPAYPDRPIEALSTEARGMFAEASTTFLRLAQVNAMNERIAAESSWEAAELSARAGERDRAVKLFQAFVSERPQQPLVPRALLRIGQLRQLSGRLASAIDAYRECYRRFPRTLEGARALVPMAQCYLAMGTEYEDLAEKTLDVVLGTSEVFTPRAPEFADALFLLGDALNRRGDFERAIATLEEALERYPDDPRASRARYLLADSYLKSGLALKADIAEARYAGEIERIRAESTARIRVAQRGFRQLITEYEGRAAASLSELEKVYLRHAYLYEADCFFETQDYRHALKLYEEAAGMYKDTPSALAAHVQIINIHVFLGQPREARAALARALVLVDAVPAEAFSTSVSPEQRQDWRRYFDWLGRSELF